MARLCPVIPTEPKASGGISPRRTITNLSFASRGTRFRWALLGRRTGAGTTGGEDLYLAEVTSYNPQPAGIARTAASDPGIIDDDSILDGQDYAKAWSTGAHMQAAQGIHVVAD